MACSLLQKRSFSAPARIMSCTVGECGAAGRTRRPRSEGESVAIATHKWTTRGHDTRHRLWRAGTVRGGGWLLPEVPGQDMRRGNGAVVHHTRPAPTPSHIGKIPLAIARFGVGELPCELRFTSCYCTYHRTKFDTGLAAIAALWLCSRMRSRLNVNAWSRVGNWRPRMIQCYMGFRFVFF